MSLNKIELTCHMNSLTSNNSNNKQTNNNNNTNIKALNNNHGIGTTLNAKTEYAAVPRVMVFVVYQQPRGFLALPSVEALETVECSGPTQTNSAPVKNTCRN